MAWPLEMRAAAVKRFRELQADNPQWTRRMAWWVCWQEMRVPEITLWRWDRHQKMFEDAGVPRPPKRKPGRKAKISTPNEEC